MGPSLTGELVETAGKRTRARDAQDSWSTRGSMGP